MCIYKNKYLIKYLIIFNYRLYSIAYLFIKCYRIYILYIKSIYYIYYRYDIYVSVSSGLLLVIKLKIKDKEHNFYLQCLSELIFLK